MVTSRVRDFVRTFLSQFGVKEVGNIPKAYIDEILNVEMQSHFHDTQSYRGYWHTLVQENLEEYPLPSGLLSPYVVKIAGERYYPQRYPYIEDLRIANDGSRIRTNPDGTVVDSRAYRWYWIEGDSIFFYPAPISSTAAAVTGTITTAVNDTITIATGSLGSVNDYRRRVILVGSTYYIILSHSTTKIVIDGSLAGTETTYTIYAQGLEIQGSAIPSSLTIGGDDNIPGSDIDAMAIAAKTAYIASLSMPQSGIDRQGIINVYKDYQKRAKEIAGNKNQGSIVLTPYTLRQYPTRGSSGRYNY